MNNPLFKNYATTVLGFFDSGRRVGEPVVVFPAPPTSKKDDERETIPLDELVNGPELQGIQEVVDRFREALHGRGGAKADGGDIHGHLKRFREAIDHGEEADLDGNPFYELTKLVFRLNTATAGRLLTSMQAELLEHPPEPVYILKSLREIWRPRTALSFGGRILATIDNWIASGKLWISILLFFGSTFTTAQGVNDVLQASWATDLFGGLFEGREGEALRYVAALLLGFTLSSAILDYKDRIFSNIAEGGGVLRGIRDAILRHPRWMILASLLTFVSIKTNYDGIVSLISKKADLGKQSEMIQGRVKSALGNRFFINRVEPDSLYDLMGLMQESTDASITKFIQVPEDEVSGMASSGDARKGPRYWGKYLIVHGGFKPGVRDVSTVFRPGGLSAEIDGMLKGSGIDLGPSLKEKILALRGRYETHIAQTEESVRDSLHALTGMLEMRGYSLEEIKRVFALEHYQINAHVQALIKALEDDKAVYEQVADELNTLTQNYVQLLQKVDRSGGAQSREYRIEGKLAIPDIQAIKDLKDNADIPVAKHKNFEELKAFLAEEYGAASAGMLLGIILFFSFCMDLTDPLVYSRWTGKIGKQDRLMFPDLQGYLKEWENDFVKEAHRFFYRRDIQSVLRGFAFPNKTAIRNALYQVLEELNPAVCHSLDKRRRQRFMEWFKGLFRLTRTADMRGFNERAVAVGRFSKRIDTALPRLVDCLFPGLSLEDGVGERSFAQLMARVEAGQERRREVFAWDLKVSATNLSSINLRPKAAADEAQWDEREEASSTLENLQRKRQGIAKKSAFQDDEEAHAPHRQTAGSPPPVAAPGADAGGAILPREGGSNPVVFMLFQKAFKEAVSGYGHTRRDWLRVVSGRDRGAMDDMDGLYDFLPDLKKTIMVTLPRIEEESLGPLEEIRERFPVRFEKEGIDTAEMLQERFQEIEKESLELLGLSRIIGDQTLLYSPVGGMDIDGMSSSVLSGDDGETPDFGDKIDALVAYAGEMVGRARAIETGVAEEIDGLTTRTRGYCDETRQILLKINVRSTELRKESPPPREMLRMLRNNATTLEMTPRQCESIQRTMEAIFNAEAMYSESTLEVLEKLESEAQTVFEQVKEILLALFQPGSIDPSELLSKGPVPSGEANGVEGLPDAIHMPELDDVEEPDGAESVTTAAKDARGNDAGSGEVEAADISGADEETAAIVAVAAAVPAPVSAKPTVKTVKEPKAFAQPSPSTAVDVADAEPTGDEGSVGEFGGIDDLLEGLNLDLPASEAEPSRRARVEVADKDGILRPVKVGADGLPEVPGAGDFDFDFDFDMPDYGDAPTLAKPKKGVGALISPDRKGYVPAVRPVKSVRKSSERWTNAIHSLLAGTDVPDTALHDGPLPPPVTKGRGDQVERAPGAAAPAALPPPEMPPVESDPGRRKAERLPLAARVSFATDEGWRFEGDAIDMSRDSLRFGAGALPPGLQGGEIGVLRISGERGSHAFPCEVVRSSGTDMTLRILARTDRFEQLFAAGAAALPVVSPPPPSVSSLVVPPAAPSPKPPPASVRVRSAAEPAALPTTPSRNRRRFERYQLATRVSFATEGGWRFDGVTCDIGLDSLRFASGALPGGLRGGERGTLMVESDQSRAAFPCEVVRLTGSDLTLRIFSSVDQFKRLLDDLVAGIGPASGPAWFEPPPPIPQPLKPPPPPVREPVKPPPPLPPAPLVSETTLPSQPPVSGQVTRRFHRHQLETRVEFETASGWRFAGTTSDVGMGGLRFGSEQLPPGLKAGDRGILRISSDHNREEFPCEVARLEESDLTLKIFSGAARFEMLLKQEIFKQLRTDHATLKKEHAALVRHSGVSV